MMVKIIKLLARIINEIHDIVGELFKLVFPSMNDKDMHFWMIGLFGIVFFIIVDSLFKRIAKWSVEVISFIYTMTVLLVVVFAIELEQKITNSGVMDFGDIVAGIKGFLVIFLVYEVVKFAVKTVFKFFKKDELNV